MFLSCRRPLAFPQSEHARLAGHLACVWGNEQFKAPGEESADAVTFSSFRAGVALHDAGYGPVDNDAIGQMSKSESRERFHQLMDLELDDRVAETIVKHHVRRLMHHAGFDDLEANCAERLTELIATTGVSAEIYAWLDTITELCDSIAFRFCFEEPAHGQVEVAANLSSTETIKVHYQYDGKSTVTVDPWPFSIPKITGYMLAYHAPDYPTTLKPTLVPYTVSARQGEHV